MTEEEYGLPKPVFENRRNEFVVTLYNQKKKEQNLGEEQSIVEFCKEPKSRQEIADFLGIKTISYAMKNFIQPLLDTNELKMTIPEKPKSRLQKYYVEN